MKKIGLYILICSACIICWAINGIQSPESVSAEVIIDISGVARYNDPWIVRDQTKEKKLRIEMSAEISLEDYYAIAGR